MGDDTGQAVRAWLQLPSERLHAVYGREHGRTNRAAMRRYLSVAVSMFTRDYCFIRKLPSPLTLDGLRTGLYTTGVYCGPILEWLCPEVSQVRELLLRFAPDAMQRDGFVPDTINRVIKAVAARCKVTEKTIGERTVGWVYTWLTSPDEDEPPPPPPSEKEELRDEEGPYTEPLTIKALEKIMCEHRNTIGPRLRDGTIKAKQCGGEWRVLLAEMPPTYKPGAHRQAKKKSGRNAKAD